ncbi:MAG: CotH kinase family protein [Planctomycetes bacterium]|nr:CotH kinase family protein [Planctomycetota bacterium]
MSAYVPAAESELHLYLAEKGSCLVDDVSIRRDAGPNLIPNPGFEASTQPWIIGGTHVRSRRETAESRSGAACLELAATGKGDTSVNRVETDTSPAMTAGPYDVSLWARWLRGSSLLVVHGEYSRGPYRTTPCFTCGAPEPNLSGNPLSAALRLAVPRALGTPGAENGATVRRRQLTGSENLGPVLGDVRRDPPVPDPGFPVTVRARAFDPDGVAEVKVFHRRSGGVFDSAVLHDDGAHGDYIDLALNGSVLGRRSLVETIDGAFVEKWHGAGSRGPLLEATGRFVFNDSGGITGQTGWEGASFVHRGDDPESYRGYFSHRMAQTDDAWEPLIALTRVLDPTATPDAAFDQEVGGIVDLDSFLRSFGARTLVSDCDALGINNGHNGYIAYDASRGLWGLVPFDVECSFVSTGSDIHASPDPGIARLLARPPSRRVYHRVLSEHLDGYWSAATARPFLEALQRATGYGTGDKLAFATSVATRVRAILQPSRGAPFRIVTNGGQDLSVAAATAVLEGEAPVDVDQILYQLGGGDLLRGDLLPLAPAWTTPTRWKAELCLAGERTTIELLGLTTAGDVRGTARIAVTTTLRPALAVTGIAPASGPSAGGTRVRVMGSGFARGAKVLFGEAWAADVAVEGPGALRATAPPAPALLEADGRVDVEVLLGASRARLERAFAYESPPRFLRGDARGDGELDLADAVAVLLHLFVGPAGLEAGPDRADADDSGRLDVSDPVFLLAYLFLGGREPADPFPRCGEDLTPDGLVGVGGCAEACGR